MAREIDKERERERERKSKRFHETINKVMVLFNDDDGAAARKLPSTFLGRSWGVRCIVVFSNVDVDCRRGLLAFW